MSDPARVPTPHAGSDALTHERALRPSSRSIALSVLAVGAASAIWTLGLPAVGIGVSPWLAELGQGLANGALQAIGCVLVLRGAAVQTGRRRVAWMTIGMGALAGTIGTAVWSFVLATTGEHPEQALIDGLYALALFLTTIGVALLPPTELRSRRVRTVDTAIVMLMALTLVWVTPVHQQIDGRVIAGFPNISVVAIVTVVTVMVAVGAATRCRPDRHGEIALMAGALVCSGLGMMLYASAPGGYPTSSRLADTVFCVGFVLAAAAGLRLRGPARPPRRRGTDRSRHWFALPEVATVITLSAITVHERWDDTPVASLVLGAVAVALAIARLSQLGMEQRRLSTTLHDSAELLYREARTDTLTSLGNRLALDEHVSTLLSRRNRLPTEERRPVAVLFIDVDHFKRFNDALGHAVGDALLVEMACRIVAGVDQHAYRIGGDEFVAVVDDVDQAAAQALAGELIAGFDAPVEVDDHELGTSVSVGVACCDDPAETITAAELMRRADLALYRAKELGRGTWAAFDPTLAARAELQHELRQGLQHAAERDELVVHFQPVAALRNHRLLGATARLHWPSPNQGLLGPDVIGPVAAEGGLVGATTEALVREVHRTLVDTAELATDGAGTPLWIGIRLTRDQLVHPAVGSLIRAVLDDPSVAPSRLRVDITEDTVVDDTALDVVAGLRDIGVHVTVEQFGTGPTSLLRLSRYPASAIRLDPSFVQSLGRRRDDTVIVTAVASLAQDLGLELSADGIDEDFQATYLDGLGFTSGRGRMFGERISREDLLTATLAIVDAPASREELAR